MTVANRFGEDASRQQEARDDRQWREIIYAGNYHSAHLPGPDFAKLADAFGIPAFKASTRRVDDAIRRPGGRRAALSGSGSPRQNVSR